MLGRLMVANQRAEIEVMQNWWRSWYASEMPEITTEEQARMPGMPSQAELGELRGFGRRNCQRLFIQLMIRHHKVRHR